jgi:GT2 family glycosyltransferase
MVDDAGEDIGGAPVAFIAYADGLREAIAGRGLAEQEGLRAQLFDRLLPMSVPLSDYERWRERFAILPGQPVALAGAVIMVGTGATEDTLESLNAQTHSKWIAASLPHTEEPFGVPTGLAQGFLAKDGTDCDFVVFAPAGTLLAPSALQRIAEAFTEFPQAQVVYADLELQSDDGSVWPLAFPAFDYERMLEQGYCAHLFALRRSAAQRSLKAGASDLYRVFNAVLDGGAVSHANIVHLPGPLATLPKFDQAAASLTLSTATSAHLQRRGIPARTSIGSAGILPAVQITRTYDHPITTVIIPTRNRQQLLHSCIESIRPAVERTQTEILIVDNDSSDPDALRYLADIEQRGATVLRVPGEFNFARISNCAAEAARGEILCLLNNDVKALNDQWLEEMLSRIADPDIGAVGAMLVWPSGVVQHGGIVLGPSFTAAHAFSDRVDSDVGYTDLLRVAHECSAVTAACMVTRRRDFLTVGGMDEVRFPLNFNDVDYCLKLRANGKRIVFTPHAKLVHLGSASRGPDVRADHKERFERELQNLRAKWDVVLAADPYYSPMLSRDPIPFSALAWPPGSMAPRVNDPPVPRGVPPGT